MDENKRAKIAGALSRDYTYVLARPFLNDKCRYRRVIRVLG